LNSRELSSEMAYRLLQTFINVYESWWLTEGQKRISKKRIQTRIIQIVYDLRFVHMLLERKDNATVSFIFYKTYDCFFFDIEYKRYE
jgi:hypothetical protein